MREGLNLGSAKLDLGAEQIGEQVALRMQDSSVRTRPVNGVAAVALQVGGDTEILVNVKDNRTAASIQAEPLGLCGTWGVASIAVIGAYFDLWKFLGPRRQPKYENTC